MFITIQKEHVSFDQANEMKEREYENGGAHKWMNN